MGVGEGGDLRQVRHHDDLREPGEPGEPTADLDGGLAANAGVNLVAAYVTGLEGDMVELAIIAEDVKKAKKVLE